MQEHMFEHAKHGLAESPALPRFVEITKSYGRRLIETGGLAVLDALDAAGRPYVPILFDSEIRFHKHIITGEPAS